MRIEFTIPVVPRSKKNNGQIVMRGKYPVLLPSKAYLAFEKDCLPYLYRVKDTAGVINYPVNVQCLFFTETKRKIDLPNLLNAIDDAMVKSGLIIDDNREFKNARDGIVNEVKSSLEDDAKPEGGKNGKAGSDRPE